MDKAEFIPSGDGSALDAGSAIPVDATEEYRFLRGLVSGMRCGILTINRAGKLLMMNEPARSILELEEIPEAGLPVEKALAVHPQLAQILREAFSMSSLGSL